MYGLDQIVRTYNTLELLIVLFQFYFFVQHNVTALPCNPFISVLFFTFDNNFFELHVLNQI